MLIYNTLTKKREEFKPLDPPNVKIYMCGPTVYDYFHIGNARSFVMSDVIRRYLIYKGYNVTFAMNLTDIDDKIIKKSLEEGITTNEIAEIYSKAFLEDIRKLKIMPADIYPRATEHMDEIIALIKKLEKNGAAYNVDGEVYYDVNQFKEYGKLSGKKTEELESGARVEIDEKKKNPLDFSLWKKAKKNEPYWDSPWSGGRPGWHIECSAMSMKHLGDTFDIHAGGHDLIFPHHENEIAQSEAANKKPFVKYWLHFGFLNIQDEKMSKSLGNFFTAREALKKYSAETIRLFFVQTHYRGPINYSDSLLQAAQKGCEKLENLIGNINHRLNNNPNQDSVSNLNFEKYRSEFEEAMDDDFNSPKAAAVIFDFAKAINSEIASNDQLPAAFFKEAKAFLKDTAENVLGIIDMSAGESSSKSIEIDLINLLIDLRSNAKKEKNYGLSDEIRNKLNELGIELRDSKEGTTFKRIKN